MQLGSQKCPVIHKRNFNICQSSLVTVYLRIFTFYRSHELIP